MKTQDAREHNHLACPEPILARSSADRRAVRRNGRTRRCGSTPAESGL